ncbi:hypothetical protein [Cryobacterium sp. W22_MBD10_FK3]|uniref:hypothetical protein n=1 Tax=Cryobacterium sp. W22_MBD10_FK3 TaxID=3240273 RepID=UPI003F8F1CA1
MSTVQLENDLRAFIEAEADRYLTEEHAERGIEKHIAARRAAAAEQPTADAAAK